MWQGEALEGQMVSLQLPVLVDANAAVVRELFSTSDRGGMRQELAYSDMSPEAASGE